MDTYKKKYKGALARCKWLLSEGMISRIAATDLFRELMDNDSENVRREIINIFHSLAEGKIPVDINYADIFTWLEKQGEQKVSVVEFNAKDWYVSKVDGKIYNAKFMKKNSTNLARKLEIEKAAMSATGIIDREEWFIKGAEWADENPAYISSEKQGEQKASYTTIVETGDGGINALVTKELPTNGCDDEQKPAEWNEDNNSIISDLLDYFDEDKCLKHEVNDIVKWLKTIKPQQKGWSEEDQNALEDVREAIVHYWGGDTQDILLYWLKSLKQRIKKEAV